MKSSARNTMFRSVSHHCLTQTQRKLRANKSQDQSNQNQCTAVFSDLNWYFSWFMSLVRIRIIKCPDFSRHMTTEYCAGSIAWPLCCACTVSLAMFPSPSDTGTKYPHVISGHNISVSQPSKIIMHVHFGIRYHTISTVEKVSWNKLRPSVQWISSIYGIVLCAERWADGHNKAISIDALWKAWKTMKNASVWTILSWHL